MAAEPVCRARDPFYLDGSIKNTRICEYSAFVLIFKRAKSEIRNPRLVKDSNDVSLQQKRHNIVQDTVCTLFHSNRIRFHSAAHRARAPLTVPPTAPSTRIHLIIFIIFSPFYLFRFFLSSVCVCVWTVFRFDMVRFYVDFAISFAQIIHNVTYMQKVADCVHAFVLWMWISISIFHLFIYPPWVFTSVCVFKIQHTAFMFWCNWLVYIARCSLSTMKMKWIF